MLYQINELPSFVRSKMGSYLLKLFLSRSDRNGKWCKLFFIPNYGSSLIHVVKINLY